MDIFLFIFKDLHVFQSLFSETCKGTTVSLRACVFIYASHYIIIQKRKISKQKNKKSIIKYIKTYYVPALVGIVHT